MTSAGWTLRLDYNSDEPRDWLGDWPKQLIADLAAAEKRAEAAEAIIQSWRDDNEGQIPPTRVQYLGVCGALEDAEKERDDLEKLIGVNEGRIKEIVDENLLARLKTAEALLAEAREFAEHKMMCAKYEDVVETNDSSRRSFVRYHYDDNKRCTCGLDALLARLARKEEV